MERGTDLGAARPAPSRAATDNLLWRERDRDRAALLRSEVNVDPGELAQVSCSVKFGQAIEIA